MVNAVLVRATGYRHPLIQTVWEIAVPKPVVVDAVSVSDHLMWYAHLVEEGVAETRAVRLATADGPILEGGRLPMLAWRPRPDGIHTLADVAPRTARPHDTASRSGDAV